MSGDSMFHVALGVAAPVLAARSLLADDSDDARILAYLVSEQPDSLPLPSDCAEFPRLARLLGKTPSVVDESPGVFSLSVYKLFRGKVGTVQRLDARHTAEGNDDSFTEGCNLGRLAAAEWLLERFGAVQLRGADQFMLRPLSPALPTHPGKGSSAGLAAALSYVWHQLGGPGEPSMSHIAATGTVAGDGSVVGVGDVREKLEGVLREAPFVDVVFVPAANAGDVPAAIRDRVVEVDHVSDALERVFGQAEDQQLAVMDPFEAARRAAAYDNNKEHGRAAAMADLILRSHALEQLPDIERYQACWTARSIRAINLLHEGEALKARDDMVALDREIAAAPPAIVESIVAGNFAALAAARASSVSIDLLDLDRAVALCERLGEQAARLDVQGKVYLYGSWCRALACRGDIDEALARSDQQCAPLLDRDLVQQGPQRLCNRIDILLRSNELGNDEHLEAAARTLAEARALNDGLDRYPAAQWMNGVYLDYWELRIAARHGDVARVDELLAGREPDNLEHPHPDHLMVRHMGEALARAGRLDEALNWLDRAAEALAADAAPFTKLEYLSSGAYASLLRVDHGRPREDWLPAAQAFVDVLNEWNPAYTHAPVPDQPRDAWADQLREALRRFPD